MQELNEWFESVRSSFLALNPREQAMVSGGAGLVVLMLLGIIASWVSGSMTAVERRIALKTNQLAEVVRLEDEFRARVSERNQRVSELARSNIRLVPVVEDAARMAGFEIGEIRPEQGEPNDDKIVEAWVDLEASGLTINRLEKFLTELEKTRGVIAVTRLIIKKPRRKDTLNVTMTVKTFKISKS